MYRRQSPALALSPLPDHNECQRRSFQFFVERSHRVAHRFHDSDFWCQVVPCWANTTPCVWEAVVALSHMQEQMESASGFAESVRSLHRDELAKLWYSRAVMGNRKLSQKGNASPSELLIGCVILATIEFQQCNINNAFKLLDISANMFLEMQGTHTLPNEASIAKFFTQYLYWNPSNQNGTKMQALLTARCPSVRMSRPTLPGQLAGSMLSILAAPLQEFRLELISIIAELEEIGELARSQLQNPSDELLERLRSLKKSLRSLERGITAPRSNNMDGHEAKMLTWIQAHVLAYHSLAKVLMSVCLETTQTSFDRYVPDFRNVVKYVTVAEKIAEQAPIQPAFVVEISLIKPLFGSLSLREPKSSTNSITLLFQSRRSSVERPKFELRPSKSWSGWIRKVGSGT